MGRAIKCCKGCVPPKRYIGCHGYCEKYIKEKNRLECEKKVEWEESERNRLLNSYFWIRGRKPDKRYK